MGGDGRLDVMASWSDVTSAAPELAATVKERFEATGLGFLATLRRDGSPRLSGIEPFFALGDLWLGSMDGARKAQDLLRDPRLALHSASVDKDVKDGDAKIAGRAEAIEDASVKAAVMAEFEARTGYAPDGPFHLFRVDVGEISFVQPEGDHLAIEWWREGGPVHRVERR